MFKFSYLYLCKLTYLICAMFVSSFKTCLYDVQMLILYQLNKNYIISVAYLNLWMSKFKFLYFISQFKYLPDPSDGPKTWGRA